jgi:hypothetical protein
MLNTRLVYCISDHLGAVCMIVTRTAGIQHVIHDSSLPDDMSHERCGAMGLWAIYVLHDVVAHCSIVCGFEWTRNHRNRPDSILLFYLCVLLTT